MAIVGDSRGDNWYPYHNEPVRGALLLALVFTVVGLILWFALPVLFLQLFAASFALGPLLWTGLQVLHRRHGVRLEAEQFSLQHPITGLRRRIQYAHLIGIELLPEKLLIAYAQPVAADPTHKPLALTDAHPKAEQRKLVIVKGIDQLNQLATELRSRAVDKGAVLPLTGDILRTWEKRLQVRKIIFVILGLCTSPLWFIFAFRLLSGFIGQ